MRFPTPRIATIAWPFVRGTSSSMQYRKLKCLFQCIHMLFPGT